jgi:Kef-type K+ transport system membrane component KefB
LVRVLVGLLSLLVAAHTCGWVFERFRQPKVIGEIVGGILLGPTLMGALAPGVEAWLFTDSPPAREVMGTVQQLGLFLLMFCAGAEARGKLRREESRVVVTTSVTGLLLPFVAALIAMQFIDMSRYWGPAGNKISFILIFSTAIAVTSIPVISRIMHDLGILRTPFARTVLGVAILEDLVLYTVLAIALALSNRRPSGFGLPTVLGLRSGSAADIAYHVSLTAVLLVGAFAVAGPAARWVSSRQASGVPLNSAARRLVLVLAVTLLYLVLDLEAFLGALLAGIIVGGRPEPKIESDSASPNPASAQEVVQRFAYAFFIPVYFALVGVNLNLRHGFGAGWFALFFVIACVVKTASVYLGARIAKLPNRRALNLAVALNARGGPGIVLATVTFAAGVIGEEFYIWLVLLAVLTSLLAGTWLQRLPMSAFTEQQEPQAAPMPVG